MELPEYFLEVVQAEYEIRVHHLALALPLVHPVCIATAITTQHWLVIASDLFLTI